MRHMLIGQRWPMPCCMHGVTALCCLPGRFGRHQLQSKNAVASSIGRQCHSGSPLSKRCGEGMHCYTQVLGEDCKELTMQRAQCRFCRMHRMVSGSAAAGQTAELDPAARTAARPEASSNGAARETSVLTFQEAIARLQSYWASVGCAVWQPFNSEVRPQRRFPRLVIQACRVPSLHVAFTTLMGKLSQLGRGILGNQAPSFTIIMEGGLSLN